MPSLGAVSMVHGDKEQQRRAIMAAECQLLTVLVVSWICIIMDLCGVQ